jgi:hypothetical protein
MRFVPMSGNETYSDQLRQEFYAAMHSKWSRAVKVITALSKIAQHKDTSFAGGHIIRRLRPPRKPIDGASCTAVSPLRVFRAAR